MFMMEQLVCKEPPALPPSPAIRTATATPLTLRTLRRTLPCGTEILAVAVQIKHRELTYSIVALPGFEGGGRDADGCMMPRSVSASYTPKLYNPESQVQEAVWPPLPPTVRLVNGHEFTGGWQFPETSLTRRLERSYAGVEPLLRQLCNLIQVKLVKGSRKQVSTTVLVERINELLANA
jgi:hypothetical protein